MRDRYKRLSEKSVLRFAMWIAIACGCIASCFQVSVATYLGFSGFGGVGMSVFLGTPLTGGLFAMLGGLFGIVVGLILKLKWKTKWKTGGRKRAEESGEG